MNSPAPASQSTTIEQSRAVAEVQAAVVIAQERPRDVAGALAALEESCRQLPLAEVAWFRYSRAGSQISGESIHLAREVARCWGNLQYGISELGRDDGAGVSEMRSYAWDLQTNTMNAQNFIVPHARDTKQGRKAIVDLRDVYENNANMGARRVREAIFAVVPRWFVDRAKDVCRQTLERGDSDKPLGQRISEAIAGFDGQHISRVQLETKLGRKSGQWTPGDLAALTVIYKSLQRGEATAADEFPPERVTAQEISAGPPADARAPRTEARTGEEAAGGGEPTSGEGDSTPPPDMPRVRPVASQRQLSAVHARLDELGVKDRDAKMEVLSEITGHLITSSSDLTFAEAGRVIEFMAKPKDGTALRAAIAVIEAQR